MRTFAKFISVTFIFFSAAAAFAQNRVSESTQVRWTCSAQGSINMGGPGGPIYQTVYGYGSTYESAFNNAAQNCYARGLRGCTVTFCNKRSF